jgi:hypothetical protein
MGRLARLIQFEAVRIAEQAQPLDDVQALREAYAAADSDDQRLLERAARLAPQLGLAQQFAQGRERLIAVSVVAALLVALLSYGLVSSVVGHDRRINAMAALLAVLGPHLLSLLLWLAALLFGGKGGGLVQGLLSLSTRLPGLGGPASRLLLQATLQVLGQSRGLTAWLFGLISHLIWTLAFVFSLAGLLLAFSFLAYQLTWETTILDGQTFARFAQAAGRLPAWFGFATPAVDHLLDGQGDHRGWAIWLLGCTLVYGLGLRLVLALVSGLWTWRLLARLELPDGSDPYVRRLLERFAALQPTQLLDAERPGATARPPTNALVTDPQAGLVVVGFELPDQLPWPPSLPLTGETDGSVASKRALLERLQQLAPEYLLVVCNAGASPDRATERFLHAASACAGRTAVLLLAADGHAASAQRWRDWLHEIQIQTVFDHVDEASSWAAR